MSNFRKVKGLFMKMIETDILIRSSPEKVWLVLTDFRKYPNWNPFIREVSGEAEAGAYLKVNMTPPGGKPMIFRPRLCAASPGLELRWLGHWGFPGLFDGEHVFRIEQTGQDHVRFRQSEQFRGILVPLLPSSLYERTKLGFEEMNQALKKTVEKLPG
jgi:hypothetical protein